MRTGSAHRPAVFLDRDDTLIVNRAITAGTAHPGSLFDPGLVRLMPGAAKACALLHGAGFVLVVVTNQGCVARGECTIAQVEATNARVREIVRAESGVSLDAVYFCPYHPKGSVAPYNVEHPWRKPQPGMILAAANDLGLDLASSWMIGDAQRDIDAAVSAGIDARRALLVGDDAPGSTPVLLATMLDAAEYVLAESGRARLGD